jgi:hypothetical protein
MLHRQNPLYSSVDISITTLEKICQSTLCINLYSNAVSNELINYILLMLLISQG